LPNQGVPDYQQKTWYNVVTPRAGLTWLFSDDVSVYALYDQCFRAQMGKNFEQKPMKPLTGYNLETGLKRFFFDKKNGT
jgi:iron complex outermembrane receptor protein